MTEPRLNLFDTDPAELAVDAVVIGVHRRAEDDPAELLVSTGSESIVAAFDGRLTDTLRLLGATGNPGEVTKVATLGTITAPVVVRSASVRNLPALLLRRRLSAAPRVRRSAP